MVYKLFFELGHRGKGVKSSGEALVASGAEPSIDERFHLLHLIDALPHSFDVAEATDRLCCLSVEQEAWNTALPRPSEGILELPLCAGNRQPRNLPAEAIGRQRHP